LLSCSTSPSSIEWFIFFSRWRFYLLPLTASGGRIKGEQCSFLYRSGHFHTWARVTWNSQHACTPWCIPVPARHVGYMPTWIESSLAVVIKNIFGPSSDQSFDWTYFRLMTVTFAIPTDNRLPPELLLLASWSSELRNSRAVKWKHNDFNSVLADWVCIYLSSIFTVRNALWSKKKVSLIYIVNCLNRGTDLNRLLISLSQITKMQI